MVTRPKVMMSEAHVSGEVGQTQIRTVTGWNLVQAGNNGELALLSPKPEASSGSIQILILFADTHLAVPEQICSPLRRCRYWNGWAEGGTGGGEVGE